ncbi:hypothetical protein, partial [Escherichia coli]|uniref:hypothetical protein n=1 Tax=Escherichia coli TaxID=562 RepID=UPI001A9048E6
LTLQEHWLAENPDGRGICWPLAILPVSTVLPEVFFFHVPDWHESVAPVLSWATRPVVSARRSEIPSAAGVQDVFAVTVFP